MAATTKSKKNQVDILRDGFLNYVLAHGVKPTSVFKFAKELKIKESSFYNHYNSLEGLEKDIWTYFVVETIDTLDKDEAYLTYGSREKLLAFYYTFLDILKSHRSYVLLRLTPDLKLGLSPDFLKKFRELFLNYVDGLIEADKEGGEITNRKYLDSKYREGFWLLLLFVIRFWTKDESQQFENTDVAIEEAVNLSYELIGTGPVPNSSIRTDNERANKDSGI